MICLLFIVFAITSSCHGQECQDVAASVIFYIQQGSSFCVNCPLTGSSIQWLIGSVSVDSISPPLNHTIFTNNSLEMRSSKTGSYECLNSALTRHEFTVALAMDAPLFVTDPTIYNETDNVRIICMSNAVPSPIRTWQRNGVTVGSFALLEIDSIQPSDAGIYTCCAVRMVAGVSVTTCSDFTITVQYPPTISSSPPANSEAAVDTDHMIQCGFEGVPTPTVVWLHNGSMLTNGSGDITIATSDSSSTLTITTLAADDAGSYTCMVSNLLGTATASSALTVQFPPDPPSNVMVTATTATQILLSWANPSDGNSPITMVTATYQSTGSHNTTETANTITSHTINGLMPNMEYTIFLQSFNVIGASGSVSVTGMTMALPLNAPTVMLTALSSTMIRVTWMSGPANSSMTAITGWTVRFHPTGDSSDIMETSHDANVNEYVLTGLSKGTSYTVSVAASNSAGMGPFTEQTESISVDPPSGPSNLTATALSHSMVRVTWGPVSDDGGADVNFYSLIVVGPDLSPIFNGQFPPDTTAHAIRDLVNNTHYRIYLSASNTRGFGPNVTTNVTTLDIGVPQRPELMSPDSSDISDVSVTVTWNELSEVEIDHYRIEYRVRVDGEWMEAPEPSSATSNSYDITGLSPGTTYQVRIFAISTDGVTSVASDMITITTRMQLPVMIAGDTDIPFGATLRLLCVLSDGSVPFSPQWSKDSSSLPGNATLEGTRDHILMIRSVVSCDAGLYTCSNGGYSEGGPATVNVAITIPSTSESNELSTGIIVLIVILCIIILILTVIVAICSWFMWYQRLHLTNKNTPGPVYETATYVKSDPPVYDTIGTTDSGSRGNVQLQGNPSYAANKPVAMQSNPAYGTAVRKDTITNTEPVMTVQS